MDFNKIISANKQNVRNIIRLITNETNEDLEQEVYLKVWKNSEKYTEQGKFKSWINTIAKNVSKDYLKSSHFKNSQSTVSDDEAVIQLKDKKHSPEERLIRNERQKTIMNAINALKPKFKEVVMLCEIDGYTYEEAAEKIKCPLGTVKSRLFKAKKELTESLQDLL